MAGNARHSAGFTLVELIIVIVLLAILAAVALPRFLNVADDAEAASLESVRGAFATSVALAHGVWAARGNTGPAEDLVVYEGGGEVRLDFNSNGWPAQQWFGAIEASPALDNVNDCMSVALAFFPSGTPSFLSDTSGDYQATYLGANACRYSLVANPGLSFVYDSQTGSVN